MMPGKKLPFLGSLLILMSIFFLTGCEGNTASNVPAPSSQSKPAPVEEEKPEIQRQLDDVNQKIEAEKTRKEETKRQEDEKIERKKQELQQLKDRLNSVKEETRTLTQQLENAGNYAYTSDWKDNIKWRLGELKYLEASIESELNTAIAQ